jgi:hypothetical protein
VLNILVSRMEDVDEDVTLAAVQGLATVLEVVPEEVVAPIFLNLCLRLGSLQASEVFALYCVPQDVSSAVIGHKQFDLLGHLILQNCTTVVEYKIFLPKHCSL